MEEQHAAEPVEQPILTQTRAPPEELVDDVSEQPIATRTRVPPGT